MHTPPSEPPMPSLELNDRQSTVLKDYLQTALSDLSMEIAATDERAYRERIKAERDMLKEIFEQLAGIVPPSRGEPGSQQP